MAVMTNLTAKTLRRLQYNCLKATTVSVSAYLWVLKVEQQKPAKGKRNRDELTYWSLQVILSYQCKE